MTRVVPIMLLLAALIVPALAATSDLYYVTANFGRVTQVPNGEVSLIPQLTIAPPRKTLLNQESVTVAARGTNVPALTWFMIENPSGGSISILNPTSILYQAGTTSSVIDIVEAWDGTNQFGRSYFNVISSAEAALAGKAIVLAGRRTPTDSLWPVTDYLADSAYGVLRYRGYTKANIQYVSPEPNADVDGNGALDDIDLETTYANTAQTFTNWANNADKLFVYLVDHGGDSAGAGYFRLNATETLTASNLNVWLDTLQNNYHTEVTVVIDCCYAGSFLDELTYTGAWKRVVIAACGTNEPTYFVAGGLVSFSDAFFSGVMLGYDVDRSWLQAKDAMATYQNAGMYENVTGSTSNLYLGASFVAGKDIPQVGLVCGSQLLEGDDTATLWADDIASIYPIDRVWCLVVPPGHNPDPENPVSDLTELDLAYDSTLGRYQTSYNGFTIQGTYKVIYYARDNWNSVSLPRQSYVIQQGFDERAILVAAGTTNAAGWSNIRWMASEVYHTLKTRMFDNESIYFISAFTNEDLDEDGTNDVDAAPSLSVLANAITNWAATTNWGGPAAKLTVYLIGEGTNQTLRVNASEFLAASDLDSWVDVYESVSNGLANVILDFKGSGAFIPALAGNTNRICVSSCSSTQMAVSTQGGLISFSKYFMSYIFKGSSIGEAFVAARSKISSSSGSIRQDSQLDDTGNGVGNEKNKDGRMATTRYIGASFVTGADSPEIGSVTPDAVLARTNALELWAAEVSGEGVITGVWCVVTPPDFDGTGDLPQTNLTWDAGENRYEAMYTNFALMGTYACTFYAGNSNEVSAPMQTLVTRADDYEVDDTSAEAYSFSIDDTCRHNFHVSNDVDWIKFYALTDYLYRVETIQQGENVDTVLDIYFEQPDGTLSNVYSVDANGTGSGIGEEWEDPNKPSQSGFYYARVSSADPEGYGLGSEYDLKVWNPVGASTLIVVAVDKLNKNHCPPGAQLIIDGGAPISFGGANYMSFSSLSVGWHTFEVPTAAGYQPEADPNLPDQAANSNSFYYGNPKYVYVNGGWQSIVFQFVPYARATGAVRDQWTGEWLANAQIEFRAASGEITGLVYNGYPGFATYKSNWVTGADGRFPTNLFLPTVQWDLVIRCTNFGTASNALIIPSIAAGAVTNLGDRFLLPADTNGNHIADAWEARYFAGSNVVTGGDSDGDGVSNIEEYYAGTSPRDGGSVLDLGMIPVAQTSRTLTWPVAAGRNYRVLAIGNLCSNDWSSVFGPQLATNGQSFMSWTDTTASVTGRYYQVKASAP